jgi:MFS transporter, DHA1 family, multidrug resistance protein
MMPYVAALYGGSGPDSSQGFAYGLFNTVYSIGLAAGPLLGGMVISFTSIPVTLFMFTFALIAVAVTGFVFMKKAKDLS